MPERPAPLPVLLMAGYETGPPRARRSEALPAPKALIDVAGRPMICRVVDALRASPRVGAMTVAGLEQKQIDLGDDLHYLPNLPSIVENAFAGLRSIAERLPAAEHALIVNCDVPLLSAEAVTWFVDACGAHSADLYLAIAARTTVEAHFPQSRRTWTHTRAGDFCSADLMLVRPQVMLAQEAHIRSLLDQRKSPLGLARAVGVGWLLRMLLGRIHPDDLRTAGQQWAGLEARPVILPFAGAAMDVDKPWHLETARAWLAAHAKVAPEPP